MNSRVTTGAAVTLSICWALGLLPGSRGSMGNLDPVELLWRGTPEAVACAARQAMVDAGAHGGFILGSGCEVPVAAPRENLHAMIESVRRK